MVLVVAATEGELRGVPLDSNVSTLVCGVGPVDAGIRVAERLAAEPSVDVVLHVGIAGCRRSSDVRVRDLVVGSESVYSDTTSHMIETVVRPDASLVQMCTQVLGVDAQPIATSAQVGGTSGCAVEAMEGFSVLRAAELMDVPAVEVRCVSNEIEEPDRARWDFAGALETLEHALPQLVNAVQQQARV